MQVILASYQNRWERPAARLEPGRDTWGKDSANIGGSSTWLTGSFDPTLNTLYWMTGNPGPDYDGDVREGDNLYSCSVIALDPDTGKLKWHFQFTLHDVHDWDSNQIPVLFDDTINGRLRKLLAVANRVHDDVPQLLAIKLPLLQTRPELIFGGESRTVYQVDAGLAAQPEGFDLMRACSGAGDRCLMAPACAFSTRCRRARPRRAVWRHRACKSSPARQGRSDEDAAEQGAGWRAGRARARAPFASRCAAWSAASSRRPTRNPEPAFQSRPACLQLGAAAWTPQSRGRCSSFGWQR